VNVKSVVPEFLGTMLLVFFAVGSAVFGIKEIGALGVALAFGFVLLALVYTFGPVSGCHVNPAITLGMLIDRRITVRDAVSYWAAQVVGAVVGAALLWGFVRWGGVTDDTGALGTNDYGAHINLGGALLLEVILTFLLVFVVMVVTRRTENAGFAGLAIGITLAAVHLVGIPLDGTSVNPARSLGPALFEGGEPLAHVWVFLVAPLVGGALAAVAQRLVAGEGERYSERPADTPPPPRVRTPSKPRRRR
jgi:aquaporin Z